MDISRIDHWAVSGTSFMHRASVASKLGATALLIASVIAAKALPVPAALYVCILATSRAAGLPVVRIVEISVFPGLFALLFALSQAGGGYYLPALIVMKALTAASAMVLLISTTPYMDVLGFMGRFMPRVVRDGLFMTYRSFFILLELMDRFLTALRLRGGLRPGRLVANAGNTASGIGILFLRAYERSERLYDVMAIRGYSGRLTGHDGAARPGPPDIPYPLMALVFLAGAVVIKPGVHGPALMAFLAAVLIYITGLEASRLWKKS